MAVKCPTCGTSFEDGIQFCDQCGSELPQPEVAVTGPPPEPAAGEAPAGPTAPGPAQPAAPGPAAPPVAGPAARARLIVTRGAQPGVEFPLNPGQNEIGRWDEEEGYMPHIDLTAQDTEGYVHRRHALIRYDGSQWWLEHMKPAPSNPTRIRGRGDKLEVGQPVALQPDDEIVVGRVILKLVVG